MEGESDLTISILLIYSTTPIATILFFFTDNQEEGLTAIPSRPHYKHMGLTQFRASLVHLYVM